MATKEVPVFLKCDFCHTQLHVGTHRVVFCPRCDTWTPPRVERPHSTLCCAECDKPLSATEGGGSYCAECNYYPSMQDTFFVKRT